MPDFKSLAELAKYIDAQAAKALKTTVAETVMQEMSDTIKEETYLQYTPEQYIRREDNGGLSDIRNYQVEIVDDNTISITNETRGNEAYSNSEGWDSGAIDGIIVSGNGYNWTRSRIYQQQIPRDFYAGTIRRLKSNGKHIIAFKQGMNKLGFKVE